MKRIHTLKRTIALFLAMLMAATSTVFADWDSFQGNDDNNGTTTVGITGTPTATTVALPNTGATTGLDVEPLVHGDRIYAFYNGGSEGAKLAAVSAVDGKVLWDIVVGSEADNVSQIATPAITSDGKTLYGAYTYGHNTISGNEFSYPLQPNGGSVTTTFTATLPHAYNNLQISTGLANTDWTEGSTTSLSATATIKSGDTTVATLSGSSYEDQGFSLYYGDYSGGIIPAGAYTVEMTVTNDTGKQVIWTGTDTQVLVNYWNLFQVSNIDTSEPKVKALTKEPTTGSVNGYGQASTPVTISDGCVYFGIYDGDRAYYQYRIGSNDLVRFDPPGDDHFYWAGATVYDGRVYFGSEQGVVYVCSEETFSQQLGNMYITGGAHIRSSLARKEHSFAGFFKAHFLYFTSTDGKLWRVQIQGDSVILPESVSLGTNVNSFSTPTVVSVSDTNCNIYVSYSDANYGTNNGIKVVTSASFNTGAAKDVCKVKDAIRSSTVVYRDGGTDYIYFTTNTWNGTGYRCTYNGTTGSAAVKMADVSGYTLQGFAMGSYTTGRPPQTTTVNFAVFGNDNNQLVIMKGNQVKK